MAIYLLFMYNHLQQLLDIGETSVYELLLLYKHIIYRKLTYTKKYTGFSITRDGLFGL